MFLNFEKCLQEFFSIRTGVFKPEAKSTSDFEIILVPSKCVNQSIINPLCILGCSISLDVTHWSKPKTYQIFDDTKKFQWNVKPEGLAFPKWIK